MTPREKQVFDALTEAFERPDAIARRAKIYTSSPRETASKYCISLVKRGLAEKGGTPMHPMWRRRAST